MAGPGVGAGPGEEPEYPNVHPFVSGSRVDGHEPLISTPYGASGG
jgi:hypothetical protein